MAQLTGGGPLASIYENRIGDATNANEVRGYWAFLAGVVLGFIGLLLYSATAPATMSRGVGYALAALAPALLMAGAVLRFPLRKTATTLVGVGLALTVIAVAWFLIVFPEGWSLTTGNSAVMLSYVAGLAVIGIAGAVIPLATDPRDAALDAADQRGETAEKATRAARNDAAAARRESDTASDEREEALQSEIQRLRSALTESESEKTELQTEVAEQQAARSDTEADEADLAVLLNDLRGSDSQFELYEDRGGAWRWRLRHDNGNILAGSGEGYETRPDIRTAIDDIREDIGTLEIEVYEDEAGGFRWRFDGDLGRVIADSGGYESRDGAQQAVERVRRFIPEADLIDVGEAAFEVYVDKGEEHRWRLRHRNGNVLASSGEGYASRSGVWDAIESVKRNAPAAEFEETDD